MTLQSPQQITSAVEAIADAAKSDLPSALARVAQFLDTAPANRRSSLADLLHAAIDLGLLSAFLDATTVYATTKTRPWPGSGYERAADDPHLIARFGRFVSSLEAFQALVDEAAEEVEHGSNGAERAAAIARRHGISVGASFVSSTIELLGASATSVRHGFDQRWRDVLDHARLHPPRGRRQAA